MMPTPQTSRKARFEAALKLAGLTAADFAGFHEVTPAHLHYVLTEVRESERLETAIDEFIQKYLPAPAA